MNRIREELLKTGFMIDNGAYVLIDGQYGSTGKGLAASIISEAVGYRIDHVTTSAGPNSGHTSYYPNLDEIGGTKIVLRQLPTAYVHNRLRGWETKGSMNAGSIVDPTVLTREWDDMLHQFLLWKVLAEDSFTIHPLAAIVSEADKRAESVISHSIGSTGKGTGAALARKVMRDADAVAHECPETQSHPFRRGNGEPIDPEQRTLIEVSQGWSLSLDGPFYPYCTSRNVTVGQAMSDAGIHPRHYRQAMMVVRTFPIRVGGTSGGCYPDQRELSWDDFDVEPERTTVTNKVRRVFTWSREQFVGSLKAIEPEHLFVNFMNYLPKEDVEQFLWQLLADYRTTMGGRDPHTVLLGYGPRNRDVQLLDTKGLMS